jgi:hypothetical protein
MEQAAFLFVGSILMVMTAVVVVIGLLIINNLLHRFWKPFTFYTEIESTRNNEPTLKKD